MKVNKGIRAFVLSLFNFAAFIFIGGLFDRAQRLNNPVTLLLIPAVFALIYEPPGMPWKDLPILSKATLSFARLARLGLILLIDIAMGCLLVKGH